MTEATTEVATEKTPLVNVDRSKYNDAKSASGSKSLNNGDVVAIGLQGLTTDETYEVAGKFLTFPITVSKAKIADIDEAKKAYSGLNDGMQRMNLGNRIRGQIAKIDKGNEKALADAKKGKDGEVDVKAVEKAENAVTGEAKLTKILSPFVKAVAKREVDAEKEKEAKAKATAKAKADADKKKADNAESKGNAKKAA